MREARRRLGAVDDLEGVAVGLETVRKDERAQSRFGLGRRPIGREPMVHAQPSSVGHHVARDATLHEHGLHRLAVLAAVDDRTPLDVGRESVGTAKPWWFETPSGR